MSMTDDLAPLASEAFFYGYPLVADLDEVVRFTRTGMGSVPAAPSSQFSHARTLAGPADTFVTINSDTLYSIAQLDLSGGPRAEHPAHRRALLCPAVHRRLDQQLRLRRHPGQRFPPPGLTS
jgi:hypothetical protein